MDSLSKVQASRTNPTVRASAPCMAIGALFASLWMVPTAAHAQDTAATAAAECRAANVRLADDLLQALSAARSKRSSFSTALKLVPVEAQLKSLKAAQQVDTGTEADCQRYAAQINVEHGRLVRVLPELQVASSAPRIAGVTAAAAGTPAPMFAPGSSPVGGCAADNEQTRSDLAQRFVHFMQMAQVPAGGLAPYQNFGRRLTGLNASMSARPDDCSAHRASLAQANIEFQQLIAMEARTAPPQGSAAAGSPNPQPDGAMPLLSSPSTEACVADLRMDLREGQQAATALLMSQPEGSRRVQAQQLLDRVVHHQVDSFSRSPMSPEACDQSRRGLGELRESISAMRDGATPTAARPYAPPPMAAVQPAPRPVIAAAPAPQPQTAAAPSQQSDGNALRECTDYNRRLYADLEREGNSLKASGKLGLVEATSFDRQMGDYREWLRKMFSPIQCGVLADNMRNHLAIVRQRAASGTAAPPAVAGQSAPNRPNAGQAPTATSPATAVPSRVGAAPQAPAVQAATAAPMAMPGKPAPPTVQPQPVRPAAAAAPPVAQRAPAPPAAAPARTPSPPPGKLQGSREVER